MIFGVFSINPKSSRFPNFRRVLALLFVFPIFLVLFIVNNTFLLLDYLFFYAFLTQPLSQPVFIVASPRSGTTYLFHSIAAYNDRYTSFKFWEIIFAPSIIQKYALLQLNKVDIKIGSPLRKTILKLEDVVIGDLKKIHPIGLFLPEEDEIILIWSLSTLYLTYFYPDSSFLADYSEFDNRIAYKKRLRIMKRYVRLIQRHNYVFNNANKKRFLSKNPMLMSKVFTLKRVIPDALIIETRRTPLKTIPSALSLNKKLYGISSSFNLTEQFTNNAIESLMTWHKMMEKSLLSFDKKEVLKVDFNKLIKQDLKLCEELSSFLGIRDFKLLPQKITNEKVKHKSTNIHQAISDYWVKRISNELPNYLD